MLGGFLIIFAALLLNIYLFYLHIRREKDKPPVIKESEFAAEREKYFAHLECLEIKSYLINEYYSQIGSFHELKKANDDMDRYLKKFK